MSSSAPRCRKEAGPRPVPVIMVCANTRAAIEEASRCRADAVLLLPINPPLLLGKAGRFSTVPRDVRTACISALSSAVVPGMALSRARGHDLFLPLRGRQRIGNAGRVRAALARAMRSVFDLPPR